MKVTYVAKLPQCLEGDFVREIGLGEPADEPFARRLGQAGDLDYYADFPRPYFRVQRAAHWSVKGVVGSCSLRVVFKGGLTEEKLAELVEAIESPGS